MSIKNSWKHGSTLCFTSSVKRVVSLKSEMCLSARLSHWDTQPWGGGLWFLPPIEDTCSRKLLVYWNTDKTCSSTNASHFSALRSCDFLVMLFLCAVYVSRGVGLFKWNKCRPEGLNIVVLVSAALDQRPHSNPAEGNSLSTGASGPERHQGRFGMWSLRPRFVDAPPTKLACAHVRMGCYNGNKMSAINLFTYRSVSADRSTHQ